MLKVLDAVSSEPIDPVVPTQRPRRVVLVNPPFQPLHMPSTGLAFIAACTHAAGHDVRVADLNYPFASFLLARAPSLRPSWDRPRAHHLGQLLCSELCFPGQRAGRARAAVRAAEIEHGLDFDALVADGRAMLDAWVDAQGFADADVVGVTLLNFQLLAGIELIRRIRRQAPQARIVVGGFYVSAANGAALLRALPEIDAAVHGEGERTFLELLEHLDSPERWPHIAGLVHRDADGAPVATPGRGQMTGAQLDRLPYPAYDWVTPADLERYQVHIPVVSIRGCYWGKCTFCSDIRFNRRSQSRSAASVVAEMEHQAARHGTHRFYFSDLASNDSTARMHAIADGLRASPHRFEFAMLFIPDNIDVPMLANLKAAGCKAVQYGIESVSNGLLKKMAKSVRTLDNLRCIKLTERAGMQALSNILKYFPGETLEEVLENYDKILRFPELLNGHVFGAPIAFNLRDGSSIQKLTDRQGYQRIDRAIYGHFWSAEMVDAIPDIEWHVEVRSPNQVLHAQLWRQVEEALRDNVRRRAVTAYRDDGAALWLCKHRHAVGGPVTYTLEGEARALYLALEDVVEEAALPGLLGLPAAEVAALLDELAAEDLIFREAGRAMATIHAGVATIAFDPATTTVENAA